MADNHYKINRGITLNPQSGAPSSPVNGDLYYDSTLGTFVFYDNGFWINLASRQDVASAASLTSADFTATVVQHSLVRITGSTAGTIHGVSASTDGNMVVIYNQTNQLITVAHQSGSEGTAANRIVTHTAQNIVIPAGMTLKLVYDSSQSRWVFAAPAVDGLDKLFEDRNVLLTQGGLITYTGTTVTFTEALALEVNQREAGGAPIVISLGSTTRNISATGRMIYAVIDRSAGTAIVTDDATTLPAAAPLNQEVFLIAKRVDAGDGTKRLYWRNGMALNEGQTVRLGASGSGSGGSGTGDDINTLRFKASFTDSFAESSTSTTSAVNSSLTNAAYGAANGLYRLSYDASKTVTGTGTSMVLSAAPAYTVIAGDMLIVGTEARRITAIGSINTDGGSGTPFTIESAFSSDPAAAAANVSQAVHTNDVRAHTENSTGLAMSAIISDSVSTFMLRYEDSAASGDAIWDFPGAALVAASASADNSSWSSVFSRVTALTSSEPIRSVPVSGSQFRARFFSAATSGSGAVNLLYYKAFLHEDTGTNAGTTMDQAYCLTSGAGTEINCTVSSDTGKTRITTTWAYATGVNAGTQQGQIMVMLDGKVLPRFIDSTVTPGAYYKEISAQVIELDADYSGAGLEVDIKKWVNTVDVTSQNSTNLTYLQDMCAAGFQGFVDESSKLTAISGTPSATQFRTFGIVGRASIPDLANDLRARMGINRIPVQQIYELQNEFGSSGERVFAAANDDRNQIRFVGLGWSNVNSSQGNYVQASVLNDYVEIVFYGTGLNMLTLVNSSARDWRATVDGGSEGSNFYPSTPSSVLSARNYAMNTVLPVTSGLTLGLHTVKIRLADASNASGLFGFEVVNESANVNVRPGTAYQNGKKLVLSSASSVAYNSTFETVTQEGASVAFSSVRGARVVEYLKADGTKAKAAYLTNSAQGSLGATSHTYEEVIRTYHWREFGAGRTDDFSYNDAANTSRAFTLEDGTTTLICSGGYLANSGGSDQALYLGTGGSFVTFVFVGTGCDLIKVDSGNSGSLDSHTVTVDGTSVGTIGGGTPSTAKKLVQLVSGLPYGTHTIKITRPTATSQDIGVVQFVVYGPKKPSIPAGAVELADYNVMADYSGSTITGTTVADNLQVPTGTLGKSNVRELTFVGAGWIVPPTIGTDLAFGWDMTVDTTNSQPYRYTFFGTGIVLHTEGSGAGTVDFTVTIDNVLNASGVARSNASNLGGGSYRGTSTTGAAPCRVEFTGLTLGLHTISVARSAGSGNFRLQGLWVITPIHAHRPNLTLDMGDTLPVGSMGLNDSRKISPVVSESPIRNYSQAFGIASDPTTTATVPVPMPDMSLVHYNITRRIRITFTGSVSSGSGVGTKAAIYVDGVQVGPISQGGTSGASASVQLNNVVYVPVSVGHHKVDVYWYGTGGTITANGTARQLLVEEIL